VLWVPRSLTRHLLFYRCCSRTPTLSTSSKARLAHFRRPSRSCRDRGYGSRCSMNRSWTFESRPALPGQEPKSPNEQAVCQRVDFQPGEGVHRVAAYVADHVMPLKDLVRHNVVNEAPRPRPQSGPDTFSR
jgi:hypothetical protein